MSNEQVQRRANLKESQSRGLPLLAWPEDENTTFTGDEFPMLPREKIPASAVIWDGLKVRQGKKYARVVGQRAPFEF